MWKYLFNWFFIFYFAVFLGFANLKKKAPLAGYKCRAATNVIYKPKQKGRAKIQNKTYNLKYDSILNRT